MEKIEDLKICETEKIILKFLEQPKNIYQIAAELNVVYDTAFKRIKVLLAKELVTKVGYRRPALYIININKVEPE